MTRMTVKVAPDFGYSVCLLKLLPALSTSACQASQMQQNAKDRSTAQHLHHAELQAEYREQR